MKIRKINAQPQEIKKLRVAAYCRVSTDSDDQKESLDTQKKHYESWIKMHSNWEFAGVFYDFGISGTKADARDGLQALLYECRIGRIDYILTKSISRFSRNTTDCLSLVRELLSYNIPIYFEKENLDTGSMESELILAILSSMAQGESESISENVKWSNQKNIENGIYKFSYLPYGYMHDKNGNKIVVPKGFKIVVDEDTENAKAVEDGIVIEDATDASTKGSQFVWIPVGKIKKTDGTITEIKLDRYTFLEDGTPVEQGENVVEYFFKELNKSNGDNITAKNIDEFKNSVDLNGGYYIGRYETRKNKNGGITEVKSDVVWNDVTQIDAANYARNMYNDKNYTCDLINSYAWDTATLFLQSFGNNKTYSRKNSLNVETLEENGTIDDKQCNVFDMASNLMEWTTETFNGEETGVLRGGRYNDSYIYTGWRGHNKASVIYIGFGFRPILYLK